MHMMVYGLGLRLDGRTVLVRGAAGGVGLILVRWASAMGARVIAIVGTQAKAEAAREAEPNMSSSAGRRRSPMPAVRCWT
ncbi:KR domain-containing protein [Tistrella bauzanensis]